MKNLPIIVVSLEVKDMDVPTLITTAKGVKTTGDPDVVNPPVTDVEITAQAEDLSKCHAKRQTDQSESLTREENELASKVRRSYSRVGRYVEDIANEVAIEAGDVNVGEAVVLRCGFKLKKKPDLHPRGFEVVKQGKGFTHLRVKAVGKKAGYAWRYGITNEAGQVPEQMLPILFTLECEVIVNGQKSGAMYAFQFASILPVSHTNKTKAALTANTKDSTLTTATKTKKATFTAGADPLSWSDFIYVGSI